MGTVSKQLTRDDMRMAAVVYRASFDERLPWLTGFHTPDEDLSYFQDTVFGHCEVWGCLEAERLLGFIAFRETLIELLYVLPAHQRHGIGTTLLSVAQERCHELDLWTFQRNTAARHFYERMGFIAVEMTDGVGNEEKEPDVRYQWRAPHPPAAPTP